VIWWTVSWWLGSRINGADTWTATQRWRSRNINTFHQWCLPRILKIFWISTDQPPFTHIICTTCLQFFGHIAHVDLSVDYSWALKSSVAPLPRDINCRSDQPCKTWQLNLMSLHSTLVRPTAYHRAQNRQAWRRSWERQHPLDKPYDDKTNKDAVVTLFRRLVPSVLPDTAEQCHWCIITQSLYLMHSDMSSQ